MVNIKLICVGKLKEKFFADACNEYIKRLGAFCRLEVIELAELRKSSDPSPAEVEACLRREGEAILSKIPKGALVTAMCIEGQQPDSHGMASIIESCESSGGKLCFIIGSSDGLHDTVKQAADRRISMSKMTFPHHLARVMLLEQIYRGFQILGGGKYHK